MCVTYVAKFPENNVGQWNLSTVGQSLHTHIPHLAFRSQTLQLGLGPVHHCGDVSAGVGPCRDTLDRDSLTQDIDVPRLVLIDVAE